jgi:hypothetical protein
VTYEQAHAAHLRTEFGLDVLQLARGKYAPNSYRDFIGFEIDEDGLKRAFESTYGLKLSDVMMPDIAIGVYRLSVGTVVPEMTKVAWESKHDDIVRLAPETDSDSFRYTLTKQEYEIQWGHKYKRPGWRQRLFAVLFKIIPPVGPFAPLKYRVVPESGEALFLQAFDATVVEYRRQLENVRADRLQLENYNLDTGEPVRRGEYELADESYKRLLKKLESNTWRDVSGALRSDIQSFYGTGAAAVDNKTARRLRELR